MAAREGLAALRGSCCVTTPGLRYLALSSLSFSVMSLLVKLAGRHFPVMELVLARAAVVATLAFALLRRRHGSLQTPALGLLALRSVVGFAALTCFYFAVVRLPLAEATVIHFTNPVFTALLAVPLLQERLQQRECWLALAGLGGVVLVAQPSFLFARPSPLDPTGVAAALAASVLAALAYILIRLMRHVDADVIVFYFAAISVVLALPFTVANAVIPRGWEWLLLLGIGLATWGGQMGLTLGLQQERAGRATSVGYLQIVFATAWGILVFGDTPNLATVLGAAIIVSATLLLGRGRAADADVPAPG